MGFAACHGKPSPFPEDPSKIASSCFNVAHGAESGYPNAPVCQKASESASQAQCEDDPVSRADLLESGGVGVPMHQAP